MNGPAIFITKWVKNIIARRLAIAEADAVNVCQKGAGVLENGEPVYLDNFSTTQLSPEAADAVIAAWAFPTNSSSPHSLGARADEIISRAQYDVAQLLGAASAEIVFTSGATEANNLAVMGVARAAQKFGNRRRTIVVSSIEHKSVLEPAYSLREKGFNVLTAPADRRGLIDMSALKELLTDDILMVSAMAVNNETGVVQPIKHIASLAHDVGALVHCDAAQAVGKIEFDVLETDVDYASLSGHKMHGPMGIGALYVSAASLRPLPLARGGGQQAGLRPGTLPAPLVAGFGAACRRAATAMDKANTRKSKSMMLLLGSLSEAGVVLRSVTADAPVVAGSACLELENGSADDLIARVQGKICISTGSACNSGQITTSHVLSAMGFDEASAQRIFRICLSEYNDDDQILYAAGVIAAALREDGIPTGQLHQ